MAAQDDQKSLTTEMDARRVALRLHWDEVAARAGISVTHLRRIRKATYLPSPLIQAKLEAALQWAPGSVQRILDGGHPVEVAPVELGEPIDAIVQGTAGRITTHGGKGSVSAEEPSAEAETDIEDDPVVAQFRNLLALAKQLDAEKLAETNRLLEEQNRLLEEQNRLLRERDEDDQHRRRA